MKAPRIEIGKGTATITTGHIGDVPALFIAPAKFPGEPGASAARENRPKDALLGDELIFTFPSIEHARKVADAFCGALPDDVARMRDFLGKVQGVCMGVAMSGRNHPNPDGALMELFNEAQAILFPPAPQAQLEPTQEATMTHDLVERLRDPNYAGSMQHLRSYDEIDRLFNQAADKIETYMAEIATLRAEKDEIRRAIIEEAATIAHVEAVKHCSARDGKTLIGHPVGQGIAAAIRNMGE